MPDKPTLQTSVHPHPGIVHQDACRPHEVQDRRLECIVVSSIEESKLEASSEAGPNGPKARTLPPPIIRLVVAAIARRAGVTVDTEVLAAAGLAACVGCVGIASSELLDFDVARLDSLSRVAAPPLLLRAQADVARLFVNACRVEVYSQQNTPLYELKVQWMSLTRQSSQGSQGATTTRLSQDTDVSCHLRCPSFASSAKGRRLGR